MPRLGRLATCVSFSHTLAEAGPTMIGLGVVMPSCKRGLSAVPRRVPPRSLVPPITSAFRSAAVAGEPSWDADAQSHSNLACFRDETGKLGVCFSDLGLGDFHNYRAGGGGTWQGASRRCGPWRFARWMTSRQGTFPMEDA